MSELVSIIVPVYKTERYLNRCVESIGRQDYSDLEIILVDDGSPDNSGKLCDDLANADKRIRVIHKANGGLSSARNAGIDNSNGKYICFVDSDDYIEKDHVSTLYNQLIKHNADLVKIDYAEVNTDDYSEKAVSVSEKVYDNAEKAFLELRVDSACVFMYKRELIGNTRFPEGKTSEDIPFNFNIFQKAKRLVYLPVKKYYYYYNQESISNGPLDKNMLNYLHFRKGIYKYYLKKNDHELLRMSEVLYARAAMGLMARMAFYGIVDSMDEKEEKKKFRKIFKAHSKAFYKDSRTALSRKLLALMVVDFYPLAKIVGRFFL